MPHATVREVIEANIERIPEGGCWIWMKARSPAGYGRFTFRKKWYSAHRAAYEAFLRPLLPGDVVMHTCDNPSCCNPAHLRAASPQQNSEDAAKKGRMRPYRAKLDVRSVRAIRFAHELGTPAPALATIFGVNKATVYGIVARRYWKHA